MKLLLLVLAVTAFSIKIFSQNQPTVTHWRGVIKRNDGNEIVFNFEEHRTSKRTILYIQNAAERLRVDSVRFTVDSVFIKMPFFESELKAKTSKAKWSGVWIKGTSSSEQALPFEAQKSRVRFPLTNGPAKVNVDGRWAVTFASDTSKGYSSIAEFSHHGNRVVGSIMSPSGDYRYLEGIVTGNKLELSAFDGSHAVLFTGDITAKRQIANGKFISGANYSEEWSAVKNSKAKVRIDESAMYLKPGEERLSFRFPDLDSNIVSINDPHFKNKIVVIQLMGSWCPNCMDETQFLNEYYQQHRKDGVEIVALAYEYSTDFKRSQKSLRKFQQRLNVKYPILITGVTITDKLRTEKTLPQVTNIKVFPSTIFLDRTGKVRKLDNSFFGPGTGSHFQTFKKEFSETIDKLLAEKS
jgi:thiol-disulfide isomerase/thioredoxin